MIFTVWDNQHGNFASCSDFGSDRLILNESDSLSLSAFTPYMSASVPPTQQKRRK